MNRFRCFLFALIVVIATVTLTLGGEIQGPGKSDSTVTPTRTAVTTAPTSHAIQPTSTEQNQTVWQDGTTILVEILLTIF